MKESKAGKGGGGGGGGGREGLRGGGSITVLQTWWEQRLYI